MTTQVEELIGKTFAAALAFLAQARAQALMTKVIISRAAGEDYFPL